jgi:CheY-like chemotaxis protein
VTTSSGLEALDAAMNSHPQAIFISDELDELCGTDLAERLRQAQSTAGSYLVGLLAAPDNLIERTRLLAAGFDELLYMPPKRGQVAKVLERAALPRASYTRVRNGVVVLAVVSLDTANSAQRLRDAMLDLLEARFGRFIIDLGYAQGAGSSLSSLWPFFASLAQRGVGLRLVSADGAVRSFMQQQIGEPQLFPSVDEAILGWA